MTLLIELIQRNCPFYINSNVPLALEITELCRDELESVVGRFAKHSHRAGALRGKVVLASNGNIEIRTSFGNKLLWTKECN